MPQTVDEADLIGDLDAFLLDNSIMDCGNFNDNFNHYEDE